MGYMHIFLKILFICFFMTMVYSSNYCEFNENNEDYQYDFIACRYNDSAFSIVPEDFLPEKQFFFLQEFVCPIFHPPS